MIFKNKIDLAFNMGNIESSSVPVHNSPDLRVLFKHLEAAVEVDEKCVIWNRMSTQGQRECKEAQLRFLKGVEEDLNKAMKQ